MSAIVAENISKRYLLDHQSRHDTLRETVSQGAKGLWSRLRHRSMSTMAREEFWALRDVSLRVEPGEVVGIIGRNGAGKSTLLKILSRITEPTTGRIKLRGRVASLLEVGTGFHPELTGRDNIFLNGAILGMTRAEIRRKFDEIVAFAEVERFLDTPVKRYSSGMYVRLAFAVAAHLEPEILIVDEVLAVGDAQFQQKCMDKMRSIGERQGQTILFVSHNLKAIEHLCTRGILLDKGHLVMDGPPRDAVADYLRRGVAAGGGCAARSLNDELVLAELAFDPNPVRVRASLEFVLELHARRECVLHDLHLFIYNSFGERAAILDLRDSATTSGIHALAAGGRARFSGKIGRLMLVEGNYRVGFALRTARHHQPFYDLVDLHVMTAPGSGGPVPYAVEYQGTTVIDFDLHTEIQAGVPELKP